MLYAKHLLPALAVAGVAVAQSNRCRGTTIENQSDAAGLASCETINGDLEIADVYANELILDGIERISGSLIIENAENLTSISAPVLERIDEDLRFTGLTGLRALSMPSLDRVGRGLSLVALPRLQSYDFGEDGISEAQSIRVINTDLRDLQGFHFTSTAGIEISNNPRLGQVDLTNIRNATGLISFSANSKSLAISFPQLQDAHNITIRNASSVGLPALRRAAGLLGFYANYFESFIAPNLTSAYDLVFNDNSELRNISLPVLQRISGAFQIANNSKLTTFDGAPRLEEITGALDFTGVFDEVELPELSDIGGQFNLQSSGNLSCEDNGLDSLSRSTRGTFTCEGNVDDPRSLDGKGSGGSGGKKSDDEGAAALMAPSTMMGVVAFLGVAAQLIL